MSKVAAKLCYLSFLEASRIKKMTNRSSFPNDLFLQMHIVYSSSKRGTDLLFLSRVCHIVNGTIV